MNTGQTILTVGAIVLLGMTVLTMNRTSLQHGVILQQTEIGLYAISLATGRIEEASGKSFDEFTAPDEEGDVRTATSASQFKDPSALGPDGGEAYPYVDDFDDFHNLTQVTYIPGVDTMKVKSVVYYVTIDAPDVAVLSKTFHKRMDVFVTGSVTQDTVKMSYIFSYWSFR